MRGHYIKGRIKKRGRVQRVRCMSSRTVSPRAPERLGIVPVELPGGHMSMVSQPRELAEALHRIAT
jgi:hypothetical protein